MHRRFWTEDQASKMQFLPNGNQDPRPHGQRTWHRKGSRKGSSGNRISRAGYGRIPGEEGETHPKFYRHVWLVPTHDSRLRQDCKTAHRPNEKRRRVPVGHRAKKQFQPIERSPDKCSRKCISELRFTYVALHGRLQLWCRRMSNPEVGR